MRQFTHTVIATRRRELSISLQDIADHLDISPQAVSKWEHGRSSPSADKLGPLAEVLQLKLIDDLFESAA